MKMNRKMIESQSLKENLLSIIKIQRKNNYNNNSNKMGKIIMNNNKGNHRYSIVFMLLNRIYNHIYNKQMQRELIHLRNVNHKKKSIEKD